jgi:hypothetical protein
MKQIKHGNWKYKKTTEELVHKTNYEYGVDLETYNELEWAAHLKESKEWADYHSTASVIQLAQQYRCSQSAIYKLRQNQPPAKAPSYIGLLTAYQFYLGRLKLEPLEVSDRMQILYNTLVLMKVKETHD